jgi:hypothetical protein
MTLELEGRGTIGKENKNEIKVHTVKTYWGSGDISPHILNLGTRWRRLVIFAPMPLSPPGKEPPVPIG